jgi:TP901 family phage tail tape measure protein
MTVVARLEAILSANTAQFEKSMAESETRMGKVGKAAGVAGLALAGGLAIGLEKSVKSAMSFQSSMELIHTQAGVAQSSIEGLSKSVLALAGPTATAPEELSKGLYHLSSQGLRGAQAMDALKIAAEGAKVGQANLEDVTNALGAVMVSGIKGAKNLKGAMGELNATVGAGDMRMQDLADAMGTGLAASATVAHVSLDQVSAALAVLGDNNIRGAKAGTLLTSTIRVLGHQSAAGVGALIDLGVSANTLQQKLSTQGLTGAIDYLNASIAKSHKPLYEINSDLSVAFGGKQATGIKVLLDQTDRLHTKLREVQDGAGSFGNAWQSTTQTTAFQFEQMKTSMESVGVTLGTAVLPWVTRVADELAKFTTYLSKNTTQAKLLVVGLGLLAGALMAARAAQILLNIATETNPYILAISAVVAAGIAMYVFRDKLIVVWTWIKNHWPLLAGILLGPIAFAVAEIIQHRDTLVRIFTQLPGDLADAFTAGYKIVKGAITGLFGKVIDWVKGALGISSPSSVFHEIGVQSIQGFINGVGSMAGVLEHAVVHMAEGALSHLNPFRGGHTAPAQHVNADAASNKQFALSQFARFGWSAGQFPALNALWNQESGWSQYAKNKSSGAYGIPQALPPTKMPYAAQEKGGSSPVAQILWGLNYIKGRYGSPVAAEAHELSAGWYDRGGWLPKGLSLALNTTGAPERVGGGGDSHFYFPNYVGSRQDLISAMRNAAQQFQSRNNRPAFGG